MIEFNERDLVRIVDFLLNWLHVYLNWLNDRIDRVFDWVKVFCGSREHNTVVCNLDSSLEFLIESHGELKVSFEFADELLLLFEIL